MDALTTRALPGAEFRWHFSDDVVGDQWSAWHTVALPCSACCCRGPEDGEHLQVSDYYDEFDVLTAGHTRFDPLDPDEWVEVEWREATP